MRNVLVFAICILSLNAFAVELNGKRVFIGDLGSLADMRSEAKLIKITRTENTPKRVKMSYTIKVPELVCTNYDYQTYPCGCYGRSGRGGYYPGPGYPRSPYRPYPGGYCGVCTSQTCRSTEVQYVPVTRNVKLKFKSATELSNGASEEFTLKFYTSDSNDYDYTLQAPSYYQTKKRWNKFILDI